MVTESSESRHLQLSVRDFGPIASADVDLRPMTVFVGPSNTGKSYLAILVYALHQFFSGHPSMAAFFRPVTNQWRRPLTAIGDIDDRSLEDLLTWLEQAKSIEMPADFHAPMPESVDSHVRSTLPITQEAAESCVEEILRCFGRRDVSRLIRRSSPAEGEVVISSHVIEGQEPEAALEYQFVLGKDGKSACYSKVPSAIPTQIATLAGYGASSYYQQISRQFEPSPDRVAFGYLADLVNSIFVSPLAGGVHYLPADRTGIMHAHRLLVRSLLRSTSWAGIRREEPLPVLSGVTADFLDTLIALEDFQNSGSSTGIDLAVRLEKKMLAGSIETRFSPTGYPEFYYRPRGWDEDMPLMNTSSMVSELAPVVLYLRGIVGTGELLIIEEPESHLHPAMQVEFVRHLAAAVRAGIRVLITTHSEWVLEELANLVHLSDLPEYQRDGIGGADYALTHNQLGIWLFGADRESGGSIVEEVRFSADEGGFVTDYEDVAIRTHNDWAHITNRLGELDAE